MTRLRRFTRRCALIVGWMSLAILAYCKLAIAAAVVTGRTLLYPIRGGWWSGCRSWKHMAFASAHRGKYDTEWLQQLTYAELQSLHSDDHEYRSRIDYVYRPGMYPPEPPPIIHNLDAEDSGNNNLI